MITVLVVTSAVVAGVGFLFLQIPGASGAAVFMLTSSAGFAGLAYLNWRIKQ